MNLNTLDEMAAIIAAVKAGKTVQAQAMNVNGPWVDIEPHNFVGNFAMCEYRLKPHERTISIGNRVVINGKECMLVAGDAWKMAIIDRRSGVRCGNTVYIGDHHTWWQLPYSVFIAMLDHPGFRDAVIEWPTNT